MTSIVWIRNFRLDIICLGAFLGILCVPQNAPCITRVQQTPALPFEAHAALMGHQKQRVNTIDEIFVPDSNEKDQIRKQFKGLWKSQTGVTPQLLLAGGSWSGGGGTGAVCFLSNIHASDALDANGKFKPTYYPLINLVAMLDSFSERAISNVYPDDTTESYLLRTVWSLYDANPAFISELGAALDVVLDGLHNVRPVPLDRTFDTGPLSNRLQQFLEMHPHCGPVQIAVRYSYRDQNKKLKAAFVDIDGNLLEIIRAANRGHGGHIEAILSESAIWLHEAVYLLSSDSDARSTRDVVDFLMAEDTFDSLMNKDIGFLKIRFAPKLKAIGY